MHTGILLLCFVGLPKKSKKFAGRDPLKLDQSQWNKKVVREIFAHSDFPIDLNPKFLDLLTALYPLGVSASTGTGRASRLFYLHTTSHAHAIHDP